MKARAPARVGVPAFSAPTANRQAVVPRRPKSGLAVRAGEGGPEKLRPTITSTRAPRQTTPPPEQIPVEHSATFLLRSRRPAAEDEELVPATSSRSDEPFAGNAVQWYLKRLDKSVDEGDAEPSPAARAYYKASKTRAGNSAAKGVGSVVGTAAKLGVNAVKAAAPIGKWAVLQGLGVAGRAIMPSGQKPKSKKDKD